MVVIGSAVLDSDLFAMFATCDFGVRGPVFFSPIPAFFCSMFAAHFCARRCSVDGLTDMLMGASAPDLDFFVGLPSCDCDSGGIVDSAGTIEAWGVDRLNDDWSCSCDGPVLSDQEGGDGMGPLTTSSGKRLSRIMGTAMAGMDTSAARKSCREILTMFPEVDSGLKGLSGSSARGSSF